MNTRFYITYVAYGSKVEQCYLDTDGSLKGFETKKEAKVVKKQLQACGHTHVKISKVS